MSWLSAPDCDGFEVRITVSRTHAEGMGGSPREGCSDRGLRFRLRAVELQCRDAQPWIIDRYGEYQQEYR